MSFVIEDLIFINRFGFEGETLIQQLELRQRDVCMQFTHTVSSELAKYPFLLTLLLLVL